MEIYLRLSATDTQQMSSEEMNQMQSQLHPQVKILLILYSLKFKSVIYFIYANWSFYVQCSLNLNSACFDYHLLSKILLSNNQVS